MTATKDDLKRAFADGMLPTGANFRDLIDTMVDVETFDAHVDTFEDLRDAPTVRIGEAPDAWTLQSVLPAQDAPEGTRRFSSHPYVSMSPSTPGKGGTGVTLEGYTGLAARVGTAANGSAYTGAEASSDALAMHEVAAGSKANTLIVTSPGRACAFEITAKIDAPEMREQGRIARGAKALIGLPAPKPVLLHGVAVTAGPGTVPSTRVTQSPGMGRSFGGVLIRLILAAVLALGVWLAREGVVAGWLGLQAQSPAAEEASVERPDRLAEITQRVDGSLVIQPYLAILKTFEATNTSPGEPQFFQDPTTVTQIIVRQTLIDMAMSDEGVFSVSNTEPVLEEIFRRVRANETGSSLPKREGAAADGDDPEKPPFLEAIRTALTFVEELGQPWVYGIFGLFGLYALFVLLAGLQIWRNRARLVWKADAGGLLSRGGPRNLHLLKPRLKAFDTQPFRYALTRLWD